MRASSVECAILDILGMQNCHFSAREILDNIKPRLPAVNPSTVYRALDRLAASGKISVSDIGKGAAVYEMIANQPHHHLVCQNCGCMQALDSDLVESFLNEIAKQSAHQVMTNHLVIFGLCYTCQVAEHTENLSPG